jgi:hypothetical protein
MRTAQAWACGWLAAAALSACAPVAPPGPVRAAAESLPRYRCDHETEFTVRFADDTAAVDAGPHDHELLLRDAGGVTPQQTVYSNLRLRAEFGLGPTGSEAVLHYLSPALDVHCQRQAQR